MIRTIPVFALLLLFTGFTEARQWDDPVILSMKERAEVIDRLLEERFETVVPELMRREGFELEVGPTTVN